MTTSTARFFIDCREFPSENNCSLRISGTQEEVLAAATQHAVSAHQHQDNTDLRNNLRGAIKAEVAR